MAAIRLGADGGAAKAPRKLCTNEDTAAEARCSNGGVNVTITFRTGTDPDIAQVQVQNKLQVAMPNLPQVVQQQGVRVNKAAAGFLQVVGFVSEDGSMSRQDIADYVSANIVDPLSRVMMP